MTFRFFPHFALLLFLPISMLALSCDDDKEQTPTPNCSQDSQCDVNACEHCTEGNCQYTCNETQLCIHGECIDSGDRHFGDACENDDDCPGTGTPGVDTFCSGGTGGVCTQINGPDFVAEGQPCADDPLSVGIIFEGDNLCYAACETDENCRPGFHCVPGFGSTSDISVCYDIETCEDRSDCNDPDDMYYCHNNGSCWFDACATNPCTEITNANGSCSSAWDDPRCDCNSDYAWNSIAASCDLFTCSNSVLDTNGIAATDNSTAPSFYDASLNNSGSCTGSGTSGPEFVYKASIPAGKVWTITMSASYDNALWATADCSDFTGSSCSAGSDVTFTSVENMTPEFIESIELWNHAEQDSVYYIIADAWTPQEIGSFAISVEEVAIPRCGNGIPELEEDCDDGNNDDNDGCLFDCTVGFGYSCDNSSGVSNCSPLASLGSFGVGDSIPNPLVDNAGPLAEDDSHFYALTFTENVAFSGSIVVNDPVGPEDPNLILYDSDGFSVMGSAEEGTSEFWSDELIDAGNYVLEVQAFTGPINSYDVSISISAP